MKKLSVLFIIAGLCFLAYGGYQLFKTENAQNNSMAEAQSLLNNKENLETDEAISEAASTFAPNMSETAGMLHIPRLESDLPIVEGTDEDDLEKGVGHYKGTAYPMQNDQIVLSGHRDTVFRRMGELEIGDELIVQLPHGDFTYVITETKVVDADDRTIISPTAPDEVLTVTTCYPFSYVGSAPDRYIITALPISKKDDK